MRKLAVQDNDVVREYLLKCRDELTCERDLRNKHDNLSSYRAHSARRLNVDACLTAARHTVQQKTPKAARRNSCAQRISSRLLRRSQLLRTHGLRPCSIAGTKFAPQVLRQIPCCDKMLDRRQGDALFIKLCACIFMLLPEENKCPYLCRLAGKTREQFICNRSRRIVFLIARAIAFIGVILLVHKMAAQEFFHSLLHCRLRQSTAQLRHALTAILA